MADTKNIKKNRLTAEANRPLKLSVIIGLPIVTFLICLFPSCWFIFVGLFFIVLIIANGDANSDIKRAGAEGEDVTLDILRGLPDSYTILNQIALPNKESRTGKTECDVIVVGPNGIFVIEVKNNNSKILGSETSRDWTVNKVGRGGTPYTKTIRNPIRQVKNQIWVLRSFLKGYKFWIEGIVYLSNPVGCLEFNGTPSLKILQNGGLVEYLQNFRPQHPQRDTEKIIHRLLRIVGD